MIGVGARITVQGVDEVFVDDLFPVTGQTEDQSLGEDVRFSEVSSYLTRDDPYGNPV
jgi:hypothetical protein